MTSLNMDDRTLLGRPEPRQPRPRAEAPRLGALNRTLLVAVLGAAMFTLGLFAAPGASVCGVLA